MAPDSPSARAADDPLREESVLLSGVRSAISSAHGDLDQSAIDDALGVRVASSLTPTATDGAAPDPTG